MPKHFNGRIVSFDGKREKLENENETCEVIVELHKKNLHIEA
jgi:hypothetical protein